MNAKFLYIKILFFGFFLSNLTLLINHQILAQAVESVTVDQFQSPGDEWELVKAEFAKQIEALKKKDEETDTNVFKSRSINLSRDNCPTLYSIIDDIAFQLQLENANFLNLNIVYNVASSNGNSYDFTSFDANLEQLSFAEFKTKLACLLYSYSNGINYAYQQLDVMDQCQFKYAAIGTAMLLNLTNKINGWSKLNIVIGAVAATKLTTTFYKAYRKRALIYHADKFIASKFDSRDSYDSIDQYDHIDQLEQIKQIELLISIIKKDDLKLRIESPQFYRQEIIAEYWRLNDCPSAEARISALEDLKHVKEIEVINAKQ